MPISVEQAAALLLDRVTELEEERVPLSEAVGRVLTRDLLSGMPQPPFDRSPLDGYALRAADSAGACRERPVSLWVVGKLYAGQESRVSLAPGQAVRLMTGSMIPSGADCVLRQEDTDEGEDLVQIYQELRPYSNFCRRGEEYGAGAEIRRGNCLSRHLHEAGNAHAARRPGQDHSAGPVRESVFRGGSL